MVSIIVPVYNCERYLAQCIQSLRRQTYGNIEIILVDDGSKDSSGEICRHYADLDLRIKYIYQENQGVSAARNTGIDHSAGTYVMFVDSDDWLPLQAVQILYENAQKEEADLVIGSYTEIYPNKQNSFEFQNQTIAGRDDIALTVGRTYLTAIVSSPWGKLFRKVNLSILRFDRTMALGEDLYFNLHYFNTIQKMRIIRDCVYFYRITDSFSLTKSYHDNYYETMRKIYKYALIYFNQINREYGCDVPKENAAYKLFSFGIAFAVRQVENGYSRNDIMCYFKMISEDSLFLNAVNVRKKYTFSERCLKILLKMKAYLLLYVAVKMRAYIRKYKRNIKEGCAN